MQRSAGRGAWARTEFAATLVVALILFSGGCKSRPKGANAGEIISADLPLGSYVRPHAVGSKGDSTKFFFPTLEIYDDAGALIYSSHESVENARVLQVFLRASEWGTPFSGFSAITPRCLHAAATTR
jgi:hypothetical protein